MEDFFRWIWKTWEGFLEDLEDTEDLEELKSEDLEDMEDLEELKSEELEDFGGNRKNWKNWKESCYIYHFIAEVYKPTEQVIQARQAFNTKLHPTIKNGHYHSIL